MGPVLKLTVAAAVFTGVAACGNSTSVDDQVDTKADSSSTPAADTPSPSVPSTPAEEVLRTNFSGQVDLVAKTRKVDKDGDCHGTGPNADLRQGAKVFIRDAHGSLVTETILKAGTIIPLGDDGPLACRLPFSTPTIEAVGRDFTARVGDRKPVKFDVDDGMDVQIKVR